MGFDWKEYLSLAKEIKDTHKPPKPLSEAALRSAVSRAYYSVFCSTRNQAQGKTGFVPKYIADDHKKLRDHLQGEKRNDIAIKLEELRQKRNDCDYKNELKNIPTICERSIKLAEEIECSLKTKPLSKVVQFK